MIFYLLFFYLIKRSKRFDILITRLKSQKKVSAITSWVKGFFKNHKKNEEKITLIL
jgi:hypothetical protein